MAGPWGSMRHNFLTRHTSCVGLRSKKKDAPLKPDLCQPVMPGTERSPFTKGDPTPGEHCACFPPVFQTQALSHHLAWQEYMTQHMLSCLKLAMSIGRPARLAETKEIFFCSGLEPVLWWSPLCLRGLWGWRHVSLPSRMLRGRSKYFYLFASSFHWLLFPSEYLN